MVEIECSRADGEQPVLRFVVVADTHINEAEEGGSSPFITNASANARARYVFNEIAAMHPAPAFVIHLGDIVHPVPGLPTFGQAVAHFKEIAAPLTMPLHVLPGNHDVGDKHIDWMPADLICDDYLQTYRQAFGPDYFSFEHGDLRFLMLNTVLFNSGLADDQTQRDWLVEQLDAARHQRVFVSMHYPPYIFSRDERGNYDNIDEPARSWLLEQLARPQVEAIFAGHVHNFWYDRVGSAEMYLLPSTAFLRHDFSEFYRIAPKVEFARGDPERYGYFLVEVFANGHVAYSIRTMGEQTAPVGNPVESGGSDVAVTPATKRRSALSLAHPKTSGLTRVGVELRHPWAETMQITATGGVQEFGRKWARNDYPLQSLWEMGVRLTKVPDIDVIEPPTAQRMSLLAQTSTRFVVTCLGKPKAALVAADLDALGVESFEVNATAATFERQRADLIDIRERSGRRIYFAKILANDHSRFDGGQFTHFVKSGFGLSELDAAQALIAGALKDGVIDGVTIRLDFDEPLPAAARAIAAFADKLACDVLVSLKLSGPSVAQARCQDRQLAVRTAQAIVCSQSHPRVSYIFDTFMDVDRGYYPRNAFIDGRFNPRAAATSFAMLNARLSGLGGLTIAPLRPDYPVGHIEFSAGSRSYAICSGASHQVSAQLRGAGAGASALDLITGQRGDAQSIAAQLLAPLDDDDIQLVLLCLS